MGAPRANLWSFCRRFAGLLISANARDAFRRDEATLDGDPMFDAVFYASTYMRWPLACLGPARHYLMIGRFAGFVPHPLFDAAWYRQAYADIGATGVDPLLHYIRHGRAEDRRPNAFLDPIWYRRRNPDVQAAGMDVVEHFLTRGAAQGRNPSARFDVKLYLEKHPKVAASGQNPLAHYLERVDHEPVGFGAYEVDFSDADLAVCAKIECRKKPVASAESALFVTHSPNGKLKPHVMHYLRSLAAEGIGVTLIVAADNGFRDDSASLYDLIDGLYVRANIGWDFAAWAHVMQLEPEFFSVEAIYWINDSVLGPINQGEFNKLIRNVRLESNNLVGLTTNSERTRHIQSYFIRFDSVVVKSEIFRSFVYSVKSLEEKEDVINGYEIRLSSIIEAAGYSSGSIFKFQCESDPTIYNWKELLELGFCFLKTHVARRGAVDADGVDWRENMYRRGYDVAYADSLMNDLVQQSAQDEPASHRLS